jgi:LytS/YehU family sensor histidine kinase
MVIALGDLLRLTLKDTGRLVTSLAEELEFADLYLGIEKLRFGERLVLQYEIEAEATSALVPHLLLQPLFENAVRHGAARTVSDCEICFRALRDGDELRLSLENDGLVQVGAGGPVYGVGLNNTLDRLRLHYNDRFTFRYSNRPQGGVEINISLPYKRTKHAEEPYAAAAVSAHADY